MKRRTVLTGLAAMALAPRAFAASENWQARLISGTLEDQSQLLGLHVKLAPGWKTYWRVPGDGGIPPQITLKGPDIESFKLEHPLPQRFTDESGEAIGYHDEVAFIIRPTITPAAQRDHIEGAVQAFFGVCDKICVPAKFSAAYASAVKDDGLIQQWAARVPIAENFITSAKQEGDKLNLQLTRKAEDIFVESTAGAYFGKPTLTPNGATLPISGTDDNKKLLGQTLRITANVAGKGLEQTITVS